MNPRPDLLALTPDDLAVLTNRGTVKRAQREVESGEVSAVWETDEAGRIQASWSDGVICVFPADKTMRDARCGCPAAELCRHLVRTVLAWQSRAAGEPASAADGGLRENTSLAERPGEDPVPASTPAAAAVEPPASATVAVAAAAAQPPGAPWNPGTIPDSLLEQHAPKGLTAKARTAWERGALVECVNGVKPWARFYDLGLTVRFPVPGDVRYAHCDCGQPGPCLHALLAVLAFRHMPAGADAALVTGGGGQETAEREQPLLAQAEAIVEDLFRDGIAAIPKPVAERWRRSAAALHDAGLIWLSGIVHDLLLELERYQKRDALFSPDQTALLAGELLIRCDALRHGAGIPRGLAGGWKTSEKAEVGYSRWIGLGSLVSQRRKSVSLGAYLQEAASGSLGVVTREVADPDDGKTEPADFAALARAGLVKGAGIRLLGGGQVLTESCRRTPDNRLSFGRARAQVSTQACDWETLRAPVLVDDFAELRARLALLPPRSLRPRREGEDFHVLPIAANSAATFDPASQTITTTLRDSAGDTAQLRLPWTARSAPGCETVLRRLSENTALFVSGQVELTANGLTINPAAIILRGPPRVMLQPWVDEPAVNSPAGQSDRSDESDLSDRPHSAKPASEPTVGLPECWQTIGALLADWQVTGNQHQGGSLTVAENWRQCRDSAEASGNFLAAGLVERVLLSLHAWREGPSMPDGQKDLLAAVACWRMAVDLG